MATKLQDWTCDSYEAVILEIWAYCARDQERGILSSVQRLFQGLYSTWTRLARSRWTITSSLTSGVLITIVLPYLDSKNCYVRAFHWSSLPFTAQTRGKTLGSVQYVIPGSLHSSEKDGTQQLTDGPWNRHFYFRALMTLVLHYLNSNNRYVMALHWLDNYKNSGFSAKFIPRSLLHRSWIDGTAAEGPLNPLCYVRGPALPGQQELLLIVEQNFLQFSRTKDQVPPQLISVHQSNPDVTSTKWNIVQRGQE